MLNRHPKALPFLFLTEMWERFGFYVVQGMLVLYITKVLGFSDDKSFTIAGLFSALAYISPMAGGWLADRLLGFRMAIVWGGTFLVLGYALLALPWQGGFYLALSTIIVGNGLFKPNISSLLGALYEPGDSARDVGFTIFYIGINLGVLLAGLSSGYIKDHFGWHAGFGLASIGLIIGLGIFCLGVKLVGMKYPASISEKKNYFLRKTFLILYCLIAIVVISFVMQSAFLGKWLLPVAGIFLLIFLFSLTMHQETPYKERLMTLIILIISSIVFWTIFLQMFLSTNLFIDRLVDKNLLGITIPTTAFYTLESIFVILLGPLFAWGWQTLAINNNNPSPILKFIVAIFLAGLGCLVLMISTYFPDKTQLINPLWIVLSYFCITIGEMLLSPIGLSAITMLSPPRLTGMMMGIWFAALGFGGQFGGMLAKLSSVPEGATNEVMLPIYRHAFLNYFYLAIAVAVVLAIVNVLMKDRLERE